MSFFRSKNANFYNNNKKEQKNVVEMPKNINTYLGQKGYTILKSDLSVTQQQYIKEQLLIKPCTPGAPIAIDKSFPAYRESDKKLYVPRYYGEQLFGKPNDSKITEGDDIALEFQGSLREMQVPVVNAYLDKVLRSNGEVTGGGGLLELPCGFGKTSISLYILCKLKKKALVIVHKEFLMNQWIERIQQFIPNAKIGKIQGQIIDIEGKDIVIGMLQSLSMKDYPASIFDSFGLTIIDEVHHISSEVFSCALFKLVTKYMLGLSATMERSDGTTRVFKMFLGDVVYKQERSKDEEVIVRGITYQTNDDEYNEVELDFRGKPAASKMLSKICNYNRRSEFILKVLDDMIKENPKQQIMIIASYRNILNYFYEAINHKQIATVGFYVGGMKEAALKQTELKQVVLATYSMAAEGLDIKTLTTLIMATPMTKIEQSVGRILRQKHENPPIVVDIIDAHANFQNQWAKRRRFFKTQNYKIIQISSSTYTTDISKWKTTFVPSASITNTNKSIEIDNNSNSGSDTESDLEEPDLESNGNSKKGGVCLLKFKK
uniref:Helicase ATP-binding domain-containing protein n=1 Tax=viral metagenome TaxID=1070528 RepID=A0A6C0I7M9_9ZZZZ